MTRLMNTLAGMGLIGGLMTTTVLGGEATTSATATNGWFTNGNAAATANWTGTDDGRGFARTRTDTRGNLNLARGVAVGVDENGLDLSFSHAIAPKLGPAYAGTFNLSIGTDGKVSGSYGGALANGGIDRTVTSGGSTRTAPSGAVATAAAGGHTNGGGNVVARTHSYNNNDVRAYRVTRTGRGVGVIRR